MTQKTTANNININYIYSHFTRSKCFGPVRKQYQINYNTIVVLIGAYLYCKYESPVFNKTALMKYVSYLTYKRFNYSLDKLIEVNMIALAGSKNLYSITDLGINVVSQVSNNSESLIYSFCSKHGIIL